MRDRRLRRGIGHFDEGSELMIEGSGAGRQPSTVSRLVRRPCGLPFACTDVIGDFAEGSALTIEGSGTDAEESALTMRDRVPLWPSACTDVIRDFDEGSETSQRNRTLR